MVIGLVVVLFIGSVMMLLAGAVSVWLFAGAVDWVIDLVTRPAVAAVLLAGLAMWVRGVLVRRRAGLPPPLRRDPHEVRARPGTPPIGGQVRDIRDGVSRPRRLSVGRTGPPHTG